MSPTWDDIQRGLLRDQLGRVAYLARKLRKNVANLPDRRLGFALHCAETAIWRLDEIPEPGERHGIAPEEPQP